MPNKIKNKFTAPKATEFTPKDIVIDVKNGRLYYKSNFAVFEVRGTIFSVTSTTGVDESTNVGNSQTTEIIFNNNGIFDGISDFTISNIQGDGTGTVNSSSSLKNCKIRFVIKPTIFYIYNDISRCKLSCFGSSKFIFNSVSHL